MGSILEGYRALDLTDTKGYICGKIIAAMGVETIKIEPPQGDPGRKLSLSKGIESKSELNPYWIIHNTNKLGITLNLQKERGREIFRRLIKKSDYLLESMDPGHLDSLGLGYKDLRKVNPGLIMTSISIFGQQGPYSRYKGGELIGSAMGGALITNGYEDRPPVKEALDANLFLANTTAVLGTMMAHHDCRLKGEGQQVDVSVQEVTASRNMTGKIFYQFDKKLLRRSGDRHHMGLQTARWIWPCKDGYVWFNLMGGKVGAPAGRALTKWIEDDGLDNPLKSIKDWKKYDRSTVDPETRRIFEKAIARFFMNHTKKEIAEEGLKRGIRACVANTPADLLQHPQLVERDFWVELDDDNEDLSLRYPKLFFHASESENYIHRRAPKLGEHNGDIYRKELGLSEEEMDQLKRDNVI